MDFSPRVRETQGMISGFYPEGSVVTGFAPQVIPHRNLAGNLRGPGVSGMQTPVRAVGSLRRALKMSDSFTLPKTAGFSEGVRSWGNPKWQEDRPGLASHPSPQTNNTALGKLKFDACFVVY